MLIESLHKLDAWLEQNGWAGYDPYDVRGTRVCLLLRKNNYTRFGSDFILDRYPIFFRRLLRVKKQINAKAMALFARAYLNLYNKTRGEDYLRKALVCLNWLLENPCRGYSGYCWGYPFDWQERVFIPRETPSGVVTSMAAHAFLDAYRFLGEKQFLRVAKSCCDFILNDLNMSTRGKDRICFSYTPIDDFHVHNANLFSASVLLRSHEYFKVIKYKEFGAKALNFTLAHQNDDGSWYYWAPPDKLLCKIDNFHTGFVLESINVCRRWLGNEFRYERELRKGLRFYADNLFLDDGTPKMYHNGIYPIDIHSCAQGIITFCELADFHPRYLGVAAKAARWTIRNMQDEEGHFYYRRHRNRVDTTPYIRWGQAWMLRALTYTRGMYDDHDDSIDRNKEEQNSKGCPYYRCCANNIADSGRCGTETDARKGFGADIRKQQSEGCSLAPSFHE